MRFKVGGESDGLVKGERKRTEKIRDKKPPGSTEKVKSEGTDAYKRPKQYVEPGCFWVMAGSETIGVGGGGGGGLLTVAEEKRREKSRKKPTMVTGEVRRKKTLHRTDQSSGHSVQGDE